MKAELLLLRLLKGIVRKNECWEWQRTIDQYGYGLIRYGRRNIKVHRLYYLLFVGEIPHGYVVHHTCGNKRCVNPAHLEAMTVSDHCQLAKPRRRQHA